MYKRQGGVLPPPPPPPLQAAVRVRKRMLAELNRFGVRIGCLLYTSDAADELACVDLGGRRHIKKKKIKKKKKKRRNRAHEI